MTRNSRRVTVLKMSEMSLLACAVAASEFLDAACRIDELLLTGKEWVARGANADLDVAAGGTGVIDLTARARDGGLVVVGMDICFHGRKRDSEDTG